MNVISVMHDKIHPPNQMQYSTANITPCNMIREMGLYLKINKSVITLRWVNNIIPHKQYLIFQHISYDITKISLNLRKHFRMK